MEFDLLSLDIDQNTYYAWAWLGGYRPRAVVIEYNASIPPDVDWKWALQSWTGRGTAPTITGRSLKAYELLGRRLGYSLVGCDFHRNQRVFRARRSCGPAVCRAVHVGKPLRAAAPSPRATAAPTRDRSSIGPDSTPDVASGT
jgi:hypothetical protein